MREIKVDEALRKGKTSLQQDLLDNEVVSEEPWGSSALGGMLKWAAALPTETGVMQASTSS